jgi:NAD(P)-dependent dehydrogenase (short-subunit alcohol dehydrogenase family)
MKTAIVTGTSGNLGQAVVRKFLDDGYHVIGTVLNHDSPEDGVANFEKSIVDLNDEENASQFVENAVAKHGRIDVAVLTVGGFAMGKISETRTADIFQQYKLNFETAYNIARPVFIQMMKQGSGRIFLIGSRPGLDAKNGKGMVAYGLAKSLLFRLSELMNDEAKGHNVVTSVVVPSTIDSLQNRNAMPDAKFENWVKPEAIADVIHFYSTDKASVIREPIIKVYGNA